MIKMYRPVEDKNPRTYEIFLYNFLQFLRLACLSELLGSTIYIDLPRLLL